MAHYVQMRHHYCNIRYHNSIQVAYQIYEGSDAEPPLLLSRPGTGAVWVFTNRSVFNGNRTLIISDDS